MMLIAFAIFLTDWLTKHFLFNEKEVKLGTMHDHTVIGIRSVAHYNTTLLSSLKAEIPIWAHHLINFSLAAAFIIAGLFVKNKVTVVALGILIGGIFGNALDKLFTENPTLGHGTFVRDIFYVPWIKNGNLGTFNAADVFTIVGSSLLAISTLISMFKTPKSA